MSATLTDVYDRLRRAQGAPAAKVRHRRVVARMMRDAKITQIYEGTNEIQRVVNARAMRGA